MDDCGTVRVRGTRYACSSGRAVALEWSASHDECEIPESVGEHEVVLLSRELFAGATIRSVRIPKSVVCLPEKGFEACGYLVQVRFEGESRITSLGKCCFKGCGLTEFDLPDRCMSIGEKCFDGCVRLYRVGITEHSKLARIGSFAFRRCNIANLFLPSQLDLSCVEAPLVGVKSIVAASTNTFLISDECVISRNGEELICSFSTKATFQVPDNIVTIRKWCFSGSQVKEIIFGAQSKINNIVGAFVGSSIESIRCYRRACEFSEVYPTYTFETGNLYESFGSDSDAVLLCRVSREEVMHVERFVTDINSDFLLHPELLKVVRVDKECRGVKLGDQVFRETGVVEVCLSGVNEVSKKCFFKCQCLKAISFSNLSEVDKFETKAFSFSGIERLLIPWSVRKIGRKCFSGCHLLKELIFEEGSLLETIKEKAFMNTSIEQLHVPRGVQNICGTSFYGVSNIVFADGSLLSISDGLLILDSQQLLVSVIGFSRDIVIPSYIRVLGRHSFYRKGHIHNVSCAVGSQLMKIEDDAFKYCQIDKLYVPRSFVSIGSHCTDRIGEMFVEEGSIAVNQSDGGHLTRSLKGGLIMLVNAMWATNVHIPDYVSSVSSNCFSGWQRDVFSLSFSYTELCEIRDFGSSSFQCSDIVAICFPASVKHMSDRCFEGCTKLMTVSFCPGCCLESFGERSFLGSSISKIVIPSSIDLLPRKC